MFHHVVSSIHGFIGRILPLQGVDHSGRGSLGQAGTPCCDHGSTDVHHDDQILGTCGAGGIPGVAAWKTRCQAMEMDEKGVTRGHT